jgi:hypothetical protein
MREVLMRKLVFASILSLAVLILLEIAAVAFQCGDRIVSTGDTKAEVIMKCGEPTLKDSREESIIEKIDANTKQKKTITIDEWTYNLGPDSFIRILRFENGKLVDIQTGNYGY